MPPTATTQGTDRSIWPRRITSIMPVAMTPSNEATLLVDGASTCNHVVMIERSRIEPLSENEHVPDNVAVAARNR